MSDENPQARPRLSVALESLQSTVRMLQETTTAYQQVRDVHTAVVSGQPVDLSGIGLSLRLTADVCVPLPMPADAQGLVGFLEDSINFLGQQVISLWSQANNITTDGVRQCEQALRALQASQPPASPPAAGPQVAPQVVPAPATRPHV